MAVGPKGGGGGRRDGQALREQEFAKVLVWAPVSRSGKGRPADRPH